MARGPRRHRSIDNQKKTLLASERRYWENAICSVCMEFPHNAVLLLCSSHNNGCRPYMCNTGHLFSNCLYLFKKEYGKEPFPGKNSTGHNGASDGSKALELTCPLCRGQVMGWTVVEPAREYLNKMKRSCMQDDCSFEGTYKELRKHVRGKHACAKPCTVDPMLEQKWKMLENQSEQEDVMSVIRSMMPGAVVRGDYALDFNFNSGDSDDDSTCDYYSLSEEDTSSSEEDTLLSEEEALMTRGMVHLAARFRNSGVHLRTRSRIGALLGSNM